MKFSELRPEFRNPVVPVTVQNAWGVEYDCPQCKKDGLEHRIWTPFKKGGGHAWDLAAHSTSMHDLTFAPSVRVISGGCFGHWNITCGEVVFHGDSRCAPRVRIRIPTHLHLEHHHHHGR